MGSCPVCCATMLICDLQQHANICCDGTTMNRCLQDGLDNIKNRLVEEESKWNVTVIRASLMQSSLAIFQDAESQEWEREIIVKFVVEEGVDAGGLRRELFSLFFKETDLLEGNTFSAFGVALKEERYKLLGRLMAMALIFGHPGIRCLHPSLTDYILTESTPESLQCIESASISNAAVLACIESIEKASSQEEYDKVIEDHSDYFEQASFHKKLGPETAATAVSIIKEHYMFYRCLGSIRQFMEGLNLHGILSLMREFSNEARLLMNAGSSVSAEDIKKYYETSFSESGTKEREIEEKVIFNFHRFLSRAEKGRVLCKVVILDGDRAIEESRQTTLADILQAFVGSPALPMNINSGLLIFEHKTKIGMSLINTCAPSITFQRTSTLVDYQNFEDTIMNMVYGCIGFGQA